MCLCQRAVVVVVVVFRLRQTVLLPIALAALLQAEYTYMYPGLLNCDSWSYYVAAATSQSSLLPSVCFAYE